MTEWIELVSAWLRQWMSVEWGLAGVFLSAVVSATLLPGSSEVVLVALIAAHPAQAWPGFFAALTGNLLGCLITFGMGWGARQGYERLQRVQSGVGAAQVERLRRWGPPALVLSVLPLVGDALVLAAGWLRLDLARSMAWIAVGKGLRYLAVILSMKGLLAWM